VIQLVALVALVVAALLVTNAAVQWAERVTTLWGTDPDTARRLYVTPPWYVRLGELILGVPR
jgi:hypothetical protein